MFYNSKKTREEYLNVSYVYVIKAYGKNVIEKGRSLVQKQKKIKQSKDWKIKNEKYLFELQKFLDKAENIEDDELKQSIINQMLRCDKILTELAEEMIEKA